MRVAAGASAHRHARYTVSIGLSPVGARLLTATFDAGRLSSDGGLIVLREIASRLGLARAIAARLRDDRDSTCVLHSYAGAHAHDCSRPRGLRRRVPTL